MILQSYYKRFAVLICVFIASIFLHVASASELDVYANNIQLFKKTERAQILIDEYFGRGNNLSEAAVLLDEVIKKDKNYVPAYIEMSRIVLKGGHIVNYEFRGGTLNVAYSLLNEAININPKYGGTYVLLGHVYSMAGQLPAASEALEKAAALGTNNPWLHNNSAFVFYTQKNYLMARSAYEKIVAKGPGKTSQQRNSYIDAIEQLMKIAYLESNSIELLNLAKTVVQSAYPDNAWTWGNAGGLLCRDGYFDLGLEYNRKALSIMQYGVARGNVAFCLYGKWAELTEAGKHKQAEAYFLEAYQINANIREIAVSFSRSGPRLKSLSKIFNQKMSDIEK